MSALGRRSVIKINTKNKKTTYVVNIQGRIRDILILENEMKFIKIILMEGNSRLKKDRLLSIPLNK
jgi:hypothetical protein